MPYLTLRWTFWSALLLYAALVTVGLSRFFVPSYETVPLKGIARSPATTEYTTSGRPATLDELLALEREGQSAVFAERTGIGRRGWFVAAVGHDGDFPISSVTHLAPLDAYLVRTQDGFLALAGRDSDRGNAIRWDADRGYFHEPRRGTTYLLTGQCRSGPCFADLGRYAVDLDGDKVLVDVRNRVIRSRVEPWG